jgi:tetratricopeptide (TPR) repeat protein
MMMTRFASLALALWFVGAPAGAATMDERAAAHVETALVGGLEPVDFHHVHLPFLYDRTLADRALLDRLLERLSDARRVDPLMRAEVEGLRARAALERGDIEAARALFAAAGGLSRWWAAGPQDFGELEDFPVLAARPPSGAAWRSTPGTDPLGWVRLAGFAWPARRQLVFLATTVDSPVEQPVAVRLGAAQAARVWVNGDEVLTTARPLDRAEDQAAEGAWLRAGANVIVVAVGSESDDWWLRMRLTSPDGSPLAPGIRELDRPPEDAPPAGRRGPEVRRLEDEIRAAVADGDDQAMTALAAYLVLRRPQPTASGDAVPICRAARAESPGVARLLERMVATEPGAVRDLLEGAVAAEPDLLPARLELARWYAERDLHELAAALLEVAESEPAAQATRLALGSALWGPLMLPDLERLSAAHPRCLEAAALTADLALEQNRRDVARAAIERIGQMGRGMPLYTALLERLAADCGDGATLRRTVEDRLGFDVNVPEVRIRLARLLLAEDDLEGAVAVLDGGLDRAPDHVELLMETARVEYAAGHDERAAELAQRVATLRPQDRRAQRLLVRLGQQTESRDWMRTPDELWALADVAPDGDPGVVLLSTREIRFLPGQLTEERVQEAILVTSADRGETLRTFPLPYVAESERLRILAARVLRRDGTEVSARQSDTPRLAEPEFNLYYDTRLRLLRFPPIEAGDMIEIAYVRSETLEANETGPYNGGLVRLAGELPVMRSEVRLVAPPGGLPTWEVVGLEGRPQESVAADGSVSLAWSWSDLPALTSDVPSAPPLASRPYLAYSNHPEWGDLADWYARHVAPRIRGSRLVEETAEELVAGVDDRLERIARLYRFVTNEVRYVGLEFGEHRFRPFSADWVLNHRIGDCKDKATLLVALAEAVGIPARFVMIRTSDQGPVPSDLALLEVFNHAIVYLPEDDLWLDGTASGHALYPPPGMDQNALAVVIDGPDSRPVTTPVVGGGLARHQVRLVRGDGDTVTISMRLEDTGEAADRRRLMFAGSQDARRVARWLQDLVPGAELMSEPRMRMLPSRDPTVLEVEAGVPRAAMLAGGGVPTYLGFLDGLLELTPRGARSGPLVVPVRPDVEWELDVDLGRPAGRLPDDVALQTRFGTLRVEHTLSDEGYRVRGYLHLQAGVVEAGQADGLRDFLVEVERALERPLEVP